MGISRVAVLVSGSGSNLQALLDALAPDDGPGRICVVVSNRKGAFGLERAKAAGVPGVYIGRGNWPDPEERNKALLQTLESAKVDWVVLAGYLDILPPEIIQRFKGRILNIHPSLIPAFCGMGYHGIRVHEAAVERGVRVSGATVHFVDEGADTGPILCQESVPVYVGDTAEELQQRILTVEHRLLVRAVKAAVSGRIAWANGKAYITEES